MRETYAVSSSRDIADVTVELLFEALTISMTFGTDLDSAGSSGAKAVEATARSAASASSANDGWLESNSAFRVKIAPMVDADLVRMAGLMSGKRSTKISSATLMSCLLRKLHATTYYYFTTDSPGHHPTRAASR